MLQPKPLAQQSRSVCSIRDTFHYYGKIHQGYALILLQASCAHFLVAAIMTAKNPIMSDTYNVYFNGKRRELLLWIPPPPLDVTSITCDSSYCWLYQKLNVLSHVDSAPPTCCHHYENKIECLSLVQWCKLRSSSKPQRICPAGLLKSGAVYIDWSWCPWGSQAV